MDVKSVLGTFLLKNSQSVKNTNKIVCIYGKEIIKMEE